ncbi:GNAT family N-acetyltransferase [Burkholderia cepacia]|uniref:GNAT family N-acetyltransferase n=1 Tax=Burkholderia cepacia TaxID=292 RepID=UPI000AFCFBB3|nr:GNAT family N-acetyltransferase [Burkholderia cepacia]MCA8030533.1 GNAT family N-acetyltransferase [Burkholderia cepacia]MCA8080550.1 GNAT family N-acetyltransferase [Burkholderia cepacia]
MTSTTSKPTLASLRASEGRCAPAMFDEIRILIEEEQARDSRFVRGALPQYLEKLATHAEFVSDLNLDGCRGFVAFYCNDRKTLTLYVTLILVSPAYRRTGLGERLLDATFELARMRGFARCRLEVHSDNRGARDFYSRLGFEPVEMGPDIILLERKL